ncbi:MAG: ArsC/Spx/MgsR family protein [Ottowia sp.]|nr:hypothetical protein [Ottowia sp.]
MTRRSVTLYGLASCDSCRKARRWLAENGLDVRFHDLRQDGVPTERLRHWLDLLGWQQVLNRRSATWRGLEQARSLSDFGPIYCAGGTSGPFLPAFSLHSRAMRLKIKQNCPRFPTRLASPLCENATIAKARQTPRRDAVVDADSAAELLLAHPAAIKRPLIEWGQGAPEVTVGFTPGQWQAGLPG